jgi:hypothetical protein
MLKTELEQFKDMMFTLLPFVVNEERHGGELDMTTVTLRSDNELLVDFYFDGDGVFAQMRLTPEGHVDEREEQFERESGCDCDCE